MAYLQNRDVNFINLHYVFQALAQGSGGVFLLVFLLKAGLTVPETMLALAATVVMRFVARFAVVPIALRFGLRNTLIGGGFILALQYPLSAEVHGLDWALFARCAATGAGEAIYWSCYHAFFASLGDTEHRGHQIGAREAMAAGIGIVAPIFGAWALMFLGPRLAFALIGCIQALGALPLLGAPQVSVRNAAPLAFSAASLGMQLYVLNGWFAATFVLAWQVALFGALGESLSAYGGTMSLAALAGSLGGMLLGKGIDAGRGISAVSVVFVAIILVAALRATSLSWPEAAIAANALGAFAICFYVPVLMAPVYNLAKASPCALRFHVATESAWDVGCCTAALLAALVSGVGISLAWIVVLTIPATAGQLWLLRRHYQSLMGSGDSLLH